MIAFALARFCFESTRRTGAARACPRSIQRDRGSGASRVVRRPADETTAAANALRSNAFAMAARRIIPIRIRSLRAGGDSRPNTLRSSSALVVLAEGNDDLVEHRHELRADVAFH